MLAIVASKTLLLLMTVAVCRFFSGRETPEQRYLLPLTAITVVMFVLTVAITFMDIKRDAVNSETSVLFFAMMLILLLLLFSGRTG
ncbi:MAG: hypothetical protein LUI10_03255 [Lachnospiraceae bacterium]|nr:hypothetical protein [Lachnospiraceae bacterium]